MRKYVLYYMGTVESDADCLQALLHDSLGGEEIPGYVRGDFIHGVSVDIHYFQIFLRQLQVSDQCYVVWVYCILRCGRVEGKARRSVSLLSAPKLLTLTVVRFGWARR